MANLAQLENMSASELVRISKDENQTKEMRAKATRLLSKLNKGGVVYGKKKMKMMGGGYAKKAEMTYGGSANGKKHMYSAGGDVKDNAGLLALKASGPKGMEAYNKITGK